MLQTHTIIKQIRHKNEDTQRKRQREGEKETASTYASHFVVGDHNVSEPRKCLVITFEEPHSNFDATDRGGF